MVVVGSTHYRAVPTGVRPQKVNSTGEVARQVVSKFLDDGKASTDYADYADLDS